MLKVPVLALLAGKDVQVAAIPRAPDMREALQGNRDAQVIELPDLNHLFQTADTGVVDEYGTISETIAPEVLELIGAWTHENSAP